MVMRTFLIEHYIIHYGENIHTQNMEIVMTAHVQLMIFSI